MIVGYVTWSGRLLCLPCVNQIEDEGNLVNLDNITPVEKDSQPHAFEKCDRCGVVVNDANVAKKCPTCGSIYIVGGKKGGA
jgi:predicted RNA-binding Zn-ribbon protein involved in translation (DUF1610 family)